MNTIENLKELSPSFVSITYGAGGSTRAKTIELVSNVKHQIGLEPAAHLTCVGHTQDELKNILEELQAAGIENVLALRGDPPKGQAQFKQVEGGFRYASELVRFIKANFSFSIGVAGYPEKHIEAASLAEDMSHLKEKVNAGGDFVVTQLFFDNKDYFQYVEALRKMGITVPVMAGIMPITDFEQIKRFASMCGAKIPAELHRRLEAVQADKEAVARLGVEHATQQCRDLVRRGAPGIHFYTLNKSQSTRTIFMNIKGDL